MPTIAFEPDGRTVDALPEETILEASLRAGIPHAHACGGKASCSSCRVLILKGLQQCKPRNEKEMALADKLGFSERARLACQTQITGDIELRRPVLDEIDIHIVSQRGPQNLNSIGEEKDVTMLFADIAGYTAFTEVSQPYDVVHILNRYYFIMGNVVKDHDGQILDYYGDGFLAIFGLDGNTNHAVQAVEAGAEMFNVLEKFNAYLKNLVNRQFEIRVGIHSGTAIIGTIGIKKMRKLAAMGDVVNFASRIESANKELNTHFLISADTYAQTKDTVNIANEFEIRVKGKAGVHKVYEVNGIQRT